MQLGGLALGDTPLAFVPLIPLLAGYLFVRRGHALATNQRRSDEFLDGFLFLALFLASCALIFFLPVQLSWYYWLMRLDLLAVPAFATAIVALLWGWSGVRVVWPLLLYLLLVWPYPFILLHQVMGPVLANLTAFFGGLVVRGLALPFRIPPESPNYFVSTGQQQFTLIISDVCSGTNAAMGFLVAGLPLALTWSGPRRSKLLWLLTGTLAAFLSNLLRVGILLCLSATAGVDFALGTVHPVLGLLLFVAVFAGMLGLARRYGLSLHNGQATPFPMPRLAKGGYSLGVATVALATAVLAVGQTGLDQFGLLSPDSVPTVAVREATALLPEIPGWRREEEEDISWQDLFGSDSHSRLVAYRAGEASVVVQFVATPDRGSLGTYSPEQCSMYHGERIVGVCGVNLGHGISARLVETRLRRGEDQPILNGATLYWLMPFTVEERRYHARIALLIDEEMMAAQPLAASQSSTAPVQQLQNWLNTTFSLYPPAPSQPEFADLDAYAVAFGRQMVEAIVGGGATRPN